MDWPGCAPTTRRGTSGWPRTVRRYGQISRLLGAREGDVPRRYRPGSVRARTHCAESRLLLLGALRRHCWAPYSGIRPTFCRGLIVGVCESGVRIDCHVQTGGWLLCLSADARRSTPTWPGAWAVRCCRSVAPPCWPARCWASWPWPGANAGRVCAKMSDCSRRVLTRRRAAERLAAYRQDLTREFDSIQLG